MTASSADNQSYRDTLATIDKSGRRVWVYPNKPCGKLHRARAVVAVALLAFLFGAPFVRVGGNPLLLFDILNRRFYVAGMVFWPQDLYLFVLATIALVIFVILFTAVFGRLFCGWMCPQTVFMEMVFRKIEFFIEGNGPRQRELDRAPLSPRKFFKKALKHGVFLGLSFLIGNTFLAYFIGTDELFRVVTASPAEHLTGFIGMLVFSAVFYFVFAWFREQACTLVCPYGRLQSVLLDSNSIVVAYDFRRGEPRGPMTRGRGRTEGDCIDCAACVKVCPTGIDIRNGTQLECVNCTACIDACNRVMKRIGFHPGLIRYASHNGILHGPRSLTLTPRVLLYSGLLIVLVAVIGVLGLSRTDVETSILRAPGTMYQRLEDGSIRNLYTVRIVNKTGDRVPVALVLTSPEGAGYLQVVGPELVVDGQGLVESAFFITLPDAYLSSSHSLVRIGVYTGERLIDEVTTTFVGPQGKGTR